MDFLAVNEASSLRWSFFQDVLQYAALGFESIGVVRTKIDDDQLQDAIELLHEMRMSVSSLSWIGGFTGSDGWSFDDAIDDADLAIRQAAQLQANCLILYPGAQNGHTNRHSRRLFSEALKILVPRAQDHGVRLAVEPMHFCDGFDRTMFDGWSELCSILCRYPEDSVGLALDLFHMGSNLELLERIPSMIDWLAVVQVADRAASCNYRCQRLPIGNGDLPLEAWLQTLIGAGFRGPLEIEFGGSAVDHSDYRKEIANARDELGRILTTAGVNSSIKRKS